MSWVEKYKVGTYDLGGVCWEVKFFAQDWAGAITEFTGAGNLIEFEFCNESDEVFDPIKESKVKITVIARTPFALVDLYSEDDMQFYVEIYQDNDGISDDDSAGTLYWAGYVDPKQYKEAYDVAPYAVEIMCIDGLSLLKEILYADEDSAGGTEYYNGRTLESQIILDIFGKIGFTEFKEFINIYEIHMNNSVDDSPMDQLPIDVDVFKDMYCDEVLKELFKKYNACIRQKKGIFQIYRPKELVGTTVYGRYFTDASTKTSISFVPTQYINRILTHSSVLRQVPGGVKLPQGTVKKVTINQDYGNKDSWIDNWEFKAETFDDPDFEYWTNLAGTITKHISDFVVKEKNGCALGIESGSNPLITQIIGNSSLTSALDKFVIELDFNWFNDTAAAATATNIYVLIRSAGGYYLAPINDTEAQWTLVPTALVSIFPVTIYGGTDIPVGWGNGWISFKREFYGLPEGGYIEIELGGNGNTDMYNCYKDIRFYASSYQILKKQVKQSLKQRIRQKDPGHFFFGGYGSKYQTVEYKEAIENIVQHVYNPVCISLHGKELDFDYLLEDIPSVSTPVSDADVNIDNILEQFVGSLAVYSLGSNIFDMCFIRNEELDNTLGIITATNVLIPSTAWNTREGEESKPLLEIIGDEIAYQYSRSKELVQMPIQETGNASSVIDIMGNFQDDLNKDKNDNNRIFVANRGTYNARNRHWELDLMEIILPPQVIFFMCFVRNEELDNTLGLT